MPSQQNTTTTLMAEVQGLRSKLENQDSIIRENNTAFLSLLCEPNSGARAFNMEAPREGPIAVINIEVEPEIFHGYVNGEKFDPGSLLTWISYVNTNIDVLIRDRGNAYKASYALTKGSARRFLEDKFVENQSCSWEEIRATFVSSYLTLEYGNELKQQLRLVRQGKTDIFDHNMWVQDLLGRYNQYVRIMKSTGKYPPNEFYWDSYEIKISYCQGLNRDYKKSVPDVLWKSFSMEDLFETTRRRKKDLAMLKEIHKNKGATNGYNDSDERKYQPPPSRPISSSRNGRHS